MDGKTLRADVIRVPLDDGGVALFDAIFDRVTRLDAAEAAALEAGDPAVVARLEARFVFDGPIARSILDATVKGRLHVVPREAPAAAAPALDWDTLARALPDAIAPAWRRGEPWRRRAETRAAGRVPIELPELVEPALVSALRDAIEAAERQRMATEIVRGERVRVETLPAIADDPGALGIWFRTMHDEALRALVGGVLGRPTLADAVVLNGWRMSIGDYMGAHPDGKRYAATFSLGLTEGLGASDGGAIAFGTPGDDGLEVGLRWLPHAGDACIFAPDPMSWHAVEPVRSGPRHTLTGWWMLPTA